LHSYMMLTSLLLLLLRWQQQVEDQIRSDQQR
jgi:hypothetical protein